MNLKFLRRGRSKMKTQSTNSDWRNRRRASYTTVVALFCFLLVGLATGCSDSSGTSSSKTTIQLGTSSTDARTVDFKEVFLQRQEESLNKPMENGFGVIRMPARKNISCVSAAPHGGLEGRRYGVNAYLLP